MSDTSRRTFVIRALAGGVLVSGAALGWRAQAVGLVGADPEPFAPWEALDAVRPGEPLGLVAAAILAASPHNTQPWRFEVFDDRIRLTADTARHLGSFDPFRRELWIGMGCALEAMVMAAPALGYAPTVSVGGPADWPVIEVALTPGTPVGREPLRQLVARRTDRGPYAPEPLPAGLLDRLAGLVQGPRLRFIAAESAAGRAFAAATVEATARIIADPVMAADSHRWYRANPREVAQHRDGVSVPTAGLPPPVALAGQLLPPPDPAAAGEYWLASTRRQTEASAVFGTLSVDDLYDRAQQIGAGRAWMRLQTAMQTAGVVAQPLNQLPELVDRRRQLGQAADRGAVNRFGDGQVTFAFRAGRPTRAAPASARRPVEAVARRG